MPAVQSSFPSLGRLASSSLIGDSCNCIQNVLISGQCAPGAWATPGTPIPPAQAGNVLRFGGGVWSRPPAVRLMPCLLKLLLQSLHRLRSLAARGPLAVRPIDRLPAGRAVPRHQAPGRPPVLPPPVAPVTPATQAQHVGQLRQRPVVQGRGRVVVGGSRGRVLRHRGCGQPRGVSGSLQRDNRKNKMRAVGK
jgi:hypothetical protein